MKKIIPATTLALAGVLLASCSQDEVISTNPGNEINFRAAAEAPSRADDEDRSNWDNYQWDRYYREHYEYGNASVIGFTSFWEFFVYGFVDGGDNLYMPRTRVYRLPGDYVEGNLFGDWDYSPKKFWPNDKSVDFYAIAYYSQFGKPEFEITADKRIENITMPSDAALQYDIVYATALNQTKQNSSINLTFHHALSLVDFEVRQSETSQLKFEMDTWTPVSIYNYVNHSDYFDILSEEWGPISVDDSSTYYSGCVTINKGTPKFFIPQVLEAWNPSEGPAVLSKKSYLGIKCRVLDGDVCVWPSQNAQKNSSGWKEIIIPFSANWERGKRYRYILTLGEGNGYDPETGDEIFVPVKLDVEVTDFQAGNSAD